jgi:serine/threonine protein kinase/tetratricopeptide (TPR) repeat protein
MVPVEWIEPNPAVSAQPPTPTIPQKPTPETLIGKKISHYRMLELLGGGGMGVVYRAEDVRLGRAVAIKFLGEELSDDQSALERFEREARAISSLDHPNICPIYEFDEYQGQPFIVMEFMRGKTLREFLAEGSFRLDGPEGLDIAIQVAKGLEAAHEKAIIHRDIKPANIFITEKNVAKILDFGVAKVLEAGEVQAFAMGASQEGIPSKSVAPNLTRTGLKLGTAGYMSPEQVRGERLDTRTDIFSFGIVLYEMATGKQAFVGETASLLQASILNDTPKPVRELNPRIPHGLERIIDKALEKDHGSRYQSAAAMSVELEIQSEQRHRKPPTSRWWGIALVLGIVLATVAAVVRLWPAGDGIRLSSTMALKGTIRSLAVLPFENVSGDQSQDYFADGMTDQLITDLGQIGSLRVISRTSAMQYKGARKALPQVARELNVDAVVEGTVLLSDKRVRITAQLVHAPSDRHLWAQSYEGDLRDVLGLQKRVAAAIAAQVQATLTPEQQGTLQSNRLINPDAYQAYLRALSLSRTIDGLQRSVAYLNQAIEKQPNYAEAYSELAKAEIMLGHMLAVAPQEAFPAAERAAAKAIALDDRLADAHAAAANVKFLYDWDFQGAEREFQRAIQLNPNSVWTRTGYADFLIAMGHPDEAVAQIKQNQQIDPLSISAVGNVAWELYWARRYDEAIEQVQKELSVNPSWHHAHLVLGLCLVQKHDFAKGIEEVQKAVDLSNNKMSIGFVAHAMALSGNKAGARKILGDLEKQSQQRYVSPWWPAIVYPDLGDKEKAFFWLEKAYQGREHDLVFSNAWPMFDSLHSDPRYQDLLRRVGLPQ